MKSGWFSFLKNLFLLLGGATLVAAFFSLMAGSYHQVSNIYFIVSIIFWIVAAVPIFSELGSNAKITIKARREGQNAGEMIKSQEERYQRGSRITFLYGSAGILCFIFAVLTLPL